MTDAYGYSEFACAEVWGGNGLIRRGVKLPGLNGLVFSQPCGGEHGGDVYYVSACSAGLFARVCLADVAGHGESVAELSKWLHDELRRRINRHDATQIFSEVNGHVISRGYQAITTAACLTYDAKHGELNYCYAGHPPVLYRSARDGRWSALQLDEPRTGRYRNLAFGVDERTVYDVGRRTCEPGDALVLYSDGLTETPDGERALFGEERLIRCLADFDAAECAALVDGLMEALHRHAGTSRFEHDDVTVLAFRMEERVQGLLPWIMIRNRLRRRRLRRQAGA